jgi:hypothetical protein
MSSGREALKEFDADGAGTHGVRKPALPSRIAEVGVPCAEKR